MKTFKSLDEQIQILRARNLTIDNENRTRDYLLSNNYYNIINGYGKYFTTSGDRYIDGATFDEITRLYLFDKEMKHALFKAIIDAESHLKAIFAYRFAETFPDKPYAYLNADCYAPDKILSIMPTFARLAQMIDRRAKTPDSDIQHYITNHRDVPIWVLVNHLNFGELRTLLTSLKSSLQNKVAKDLCGFIRQHIPTAGVFPPETMISFIENINDIRNICAHNNRLLGFECRRDAKYWSDLHDIYGIKATDPRRNVYSVFITLQCFLSKTEFSSLHNKISKLMRSQLKHIHTVSRDVILSTLGFPQN